MNQNARTTPATPRDYNSAQSRRYHRELLPHLAAGLSALPPGARILDAGCGNGFVSGELLKRGYRVLGIDVSESGIGVCRREYPEGRFEVASICDPEIQRVTGEDFDAIVASEVIEHLYSPAMFLGISHRLLTKSGILVLSTPYHGYLKNLLLALAGKLEAHFQAGHEGGHIKFWSRRSLEKALEDHGFRVAGFSGCGRIPFLWKSMIVKAVKVG